MPRRLPMPPLFDLLVQLVRAALADHLRRRFLRRRFLLFHHIADGNRLAERIHDDLHIAFVISSAYAILPLFNAMSCRLKVPAGRLRRLLELEGPVIALVLRRSRSTEGFTRLIDWNHDVMREQRQDLDLEVDLVERREKLLFGPVGIGDRDFCGRETRPRDPARASRFRRADVASRPSGRP